MKFARGLSFGGFPRLSFILSPKCIGCKSRCNYTHLIHLMLISGVHRITCSSGNYGQEREARNSSEKWQGNSRDVSRIRRGPGASRWTRIEDERLGRGRVGRRGDVDFDKREDRRAYIPRTATNISPHRAGILEKYVDMLLECSLEIAMVASCRIAALIILTTPLP